MQKYNSFVEIEDSKGTMVGLLQIMLFSFGGIFLFQFLGIGVASVLFDMGLTELTFAITGQSQDPKYKMALFLVQALGSFGGFILAPLSYIYFYQKRAVGKYFVANIGHWQPIVLTVFITISFMVVNSPVIEWNMHVKFPEFMAEFESWAQNYEERMRKLTEYLTDFTNLGELLVAIVVVGVIPAVGEELLFRGLIQTRLQRITNNAHVAIWLSAFIFSAIHLQFYGFVPRVLLGALFGYFFYWSGSLPIAMLAHFVNNSFSLIMLYLYKKGLIGINMDDTGSVLLETVTFFFIIGTALTYFFIRVYQNKEKIDG